VLAKLYSEEQPWALFLNLYPTLDINT
jgi:hypothetical protein